MRRSPKTSWQADDKQSHDRHRSQTQVRQAELLRCSTLANGKKITFHIIDHRVAVTKLNPYANHTALNWIVRGSKSLRQDTALPSTSPKQKLSQLLVSNQTVTQRSKAMTSADDVIDTSLEFLTMESSDIDRNEQRWPRARFKIATISGLCPWQTSSIRDKQRYPVFEKALVDRRCHAVVVHKI